MCMLIMGCVCCILKPLFLQLMVKFPEPYDKMLSLAEGEDWRRIRNTLSPTFTAHKMKQMVPLMNSACDTLMIKMEEFSRTEESFDVMK